MAAFYGSQYGNAAYSFVMSGLAPAQYTIQIYAHNTVTNSWTIFERTTTVTATPLHTIETPSTNQGVTQPFALTGWAIDGAHPTGTGVDAVDVPGYHNFGSGSPLLSLGSATYSGSRPAVSALYGARFDPSGYTKTLSALTAGWYWFVVSSHNVRDNSWTIRTQTAFVDILTSTLNITRGGTGTGGITASPSMVSCPGGSTTQAMPCPEATYPTGTIVTLTAVPDAGSTFAGWVGACSGTAPCPILLNGARHVTAMFSAIPGSIATRYYHTDVIGPVRAITDETGAVVIRRDYAPFGEDSNPDLTGDPMRFAGKELDPETGMNYFAARYYRNTWGRFASVDPVSGWASDPQSWNRYAYARNNPLRYVDPSGLSYWTCTDGCFWVHETWENFSTLMEQYGQHTYGDRSGGRIYDDFGREGTYDYHCYLVCDGGRPYPPNDPPPSPPPPDDDPPSRCALALSACPKPPDNEDKGPKNKDPGKALRPVPDPPGADRAWQWASRVKDAGRATGGIPVMSLPRRRWRSRDRRAREQRGAIS